MQSANFSIASEGQGPKKVFDDPTKEWGGPVVEEGRFDLNFVRRNDRKPCLPLSGRYKPVKTSVKFEGLIHTRQQAAVALALYRGESHTSAISKATAVKIRTVQLVLNRWELLGLVTWHPAGRRRERHWRLVKPGIWAELIKEARRVKRRFKGPKRSENT